MSARFPSKMRCPHNNPRNDPEEPCRRSRAGYSMYGEIPGPTVRTLFLPLIRSAL